MDRKDPEFRIINSELKIAKGDYLLLIMNNESKKLLEIQKTKERYKYLEEFDDEIDRYRKDLETADEEDRKIIEKIIILLLNPFHSCFVLFLILIIYCIL